MTEITRKVVRKWHTLRLYELHHQHDNAYLFAEDAEDEEQMRAAIFQEWCAVSQAAKMEIPPVHFVKEYAEGLV